MTESDRERDEQKGVAGPEGTHESQAGVQGELVSDGRLPGEGPAMGGAVEEGHEGRDQGRGEGGETGGASEDGDGRGGPRDQGRGGEREEEAGDAGGSPSLPPPPPVEGLAAARQRRDVVSDFREHLSAPGRAWERQVLQRQREASEDSREQALWAYELGELQERFSGREAEAVKSYREAVRLHPGLLVNLWAVRRVLYQRKKWENLTKVLDAERKVADTRRHRAEVLVEKGWILESFLGDIEGARNAYEEALEEDPGYLAAWMRLEGLLAATGQVEALVSTCERHARSVAEPGRRAAILAELARLGARAGVGYEARKAWIESALEAGEPDENLLWELERLAAAEGQFEDLYQVLGRTVEFLRQSGREAEAVVAARRRARVALKDLDAPEAALEAIRDVMDLAETCPVLWADELLLCWSQGLWEEAASALEQLADKTTGGPWSRWLHAARILSGRDVEPLEEGEIEARLLNFHEAVEKRDWARAAGILAAEAEACDGEASAGFFTGAAHLLLFGGDLDEDGLDQVSRFCERALELVPGFQPAAYLLEEALARSGAWEKLLEFLASRLESADETEAVRLAEGVLYLAYRKLEGAGERLAVAGRVAELLPDSGVALFRVAALAEEHGAWAAAAEAWARLSERAGDQAEQVRLLVRAADLAWTELGDSETALRYLERALEVQPGDETVLHVFERICEREQKWSRLAEVLRDQGLSSQGLSGRRLLLRAAEVLAVHLGRMEEAVELLRDLVDQGAEEAGALWLLVEAWLEAKDWDNLAEFLADRIEVQEVEEWLVRLGALAAEFFLENRELADRFHVHLLRRNKENGPLVLSLLWSAWAEARPARAAEVLAEWKYPPGLGSSVEERAVIAEADGDLSTAWQHWSEAREEGGGVRRRAAWAGLRQAAAEMNRQARVAIEGELADTSEGVLGHVLGMRAGLHAYMAGEEGRELGEDEASRMLACFVEGGRDHEKLAWLAEREADSRWKGWFAFRAGLAAAGSGRLEDAFKLVSQAMEALPGRPEPVAVCLELARAAGAQEAECVLWTRLGERLRNPEASADAFLAGAVGLERLGRTEEAAWAYRQALVRRPEDTRAYDGLEHVLEGGGHWEELREALTRRIQAGGDRESLVAAYSKRAWVSEEKLGDPESAARDYARLLALDPQHGEALYRLGRLYAMDGQGPRASELLSRCIEVAQGSELGVEAKFLLAEVLELQMADREAARRMLRDAVGERNDQAAWERWLSFAVRNRLWEDAEEAFGRLEEFSRSDQDRARVYLREATFYQEYVVNLEKAIQRLELARAVAPLDLEPVRRLVSIYRERNDRGLVEGLLSAAARSQTSHLGEYPCEVQGYRNLVELADLASWPERKFHALSALAALGHLEGQEASWYEAQRKDFFLIAKPLREGDWVSDVLRPEVREAGATQLWAVIGRAVAKLEGRDPGGLGLGRSDRISPKNAGANLKQVLKAAELLGVEVEAIYRSASGERFGGLDGGDGCVLLAGSDSERAPLDASDWFRLGELFAAARLRALTLEHVPPDRALLYLVAATVEAVPEYEHDLPREKVAETARALRKAMSRKERKALPVAAVTFARTPFELEAWLTALRRTRHRLGLLLCGDLEKAAAELCRREGVDLEAVQGPKRRELVERCSDAGELLVYGVSEVFARLRAQLGMSREVS